MAADPPPLSSITFYLNGQKKTIERPATEQTLLQWLRDNRLTGTKLGCGEGGCGACTVLLQHYDRTGKLVVHRSVNACLYPLCAVDGQHVITVEGIGSSRTRLHAIQERMAAMYSSQCGFCTPGIVMSMYALLRNNPTPTMQDIEENFDGNLCRCTGYRPILDALRTFAKDSDGTAGCCGGAGKSGGCCMDDLQKKADKNEAIDCTFGSKSENRLVSVNSKLSEYLPEAELIFPPALRDKAVLPLDIAGSTVRWLRPVSLAALLGAKAANPAAKLVVGNTEVGIEVKFKNALYPVVIDPTAVPELQVIECVEGGVFVGGAVTLNRLRRVLESQVACRPSHATRGYRALLQQLRWFAGNQIRNAASLAGNLVTASPIGDLAPVLLSLNAHLLVAAAGVADRVQPLRSFYLDYRKVALAPSEIVRGVFVPECAADVYIYAFKQAKRREDDIAIVTAGLAVRLAEPTVAGEEPTVLEAQLHFGGMGKMPLGAPLTAAALTGQRWNEAPVSSAADRLSTDLPLSADAPGGMVEFRSTLAASFLFKLYCFSAAERASLPAHLSSVIERLDAIHRPVSHGSQSFSLKDHHHVGEVGTAVSHRSAAAHTTGEAVYTDDISPPIGTRVGVFVQSSRAHARFELDASKLPADAVLVTAADVPGRNDIGDGIAPTGLEHDEECFPRDTCVYYGQPLALALADSESAARRAARTVSVKYTDLKPVLSIQEAIACDSYHSWPHHLRKGVGGPGKDEAAEIGARLAECEFSVSGQFNIGAQEHFYLECGACLCVPSDNGEMHITASTQNLTKTQHFAARVLGVPENRVVATAKRIGGGFGGKETRTLNLTCAAAVAAHKVRGPVKVNLDRDVDIVTTGQRHPFFARYQVGFDRTGKVLVEDVEIFANGGHSRDLSGPVTDRALLHLDGAYRCDYIRYRAHICRTNLPSNTAFRGFGGPQGMAIKENILDHVQQALAERARLVLCDYALRAPLLYSEGEVTPYGQPLEDCRLARLTAELRVSSQWDARLAAVTAFNRESRYKKRGLSFIPTKFGIAFTHTPLNQGGALIHIYLDGSVLVTHGGVEMGQGLHTKVAQAAAHALEIPVESVHVMETATDKVANTPPTAASINSDLYCQAVVNAAEILVDRLRPVADEMKAETGERPALKDLAFKAWCKRINLSAQGFHAPQDIYMHWDQHGGKGHPFRYLTYGAAVSEVEVDVLTGDFDIVRSDIHMDVGESINPGIDVGQIEGAFVQGAGWCTIEEFVWGNDQRKWLPPGAVLTRGPGQYKIPGFGNIPHEFRVSLMKNVNNKRVVFSSKGVGEPPLFLGSTVFFAIKKAIYAARADAGITGPFQLDMPAMPERIRMSCQDSITAKFAPAGFRPKGSW